MNILFINDQDIDPSRGGVKRVTHIISSMFVNNYDIKCYLAYTQSYGISQDSVFSGKIRLEEDPFAQLDAFIMDKKIDIIILQKMLDKKYRIVHVLMEISKLRSCKLLYVLHFSPESALKAISFQNIVHSLVYGRPLLLKTVSLCKIVTYPFYRSLKYGQLRRFYRKLYHQFDRIVLLSPRYIPIYARYAGLKSCDRLVAIGNPVSFEDIKAESREADKKKEVLIVARFDEKQKKLLRALRIWHVIEKNPEMSDWKLKIVGFGSWEARYRKVARKLELNNVSFEGGPKDPFPYYEQASIFMMTSAYEGLSMVLLESQQMGVVPIAFDSFASIRDVIKDGYNGIIVADADLDEYAKRLIWLMENEKEREMLSRNAIQSSKEFSWDKIAQQWVDLFNALRH